MRKYADVMQSFIFQRRELIGDLPVYFNSFFSIKMHENPQNKTKFRIMFFCFPVLRLFSSLISHLSVVAAIKRGYGKDRLVKKATLNFQVIYHGVVQLLCRGTTWSNEHLELVQHSGSTSPRQGP